MSCPGRAELGNCPILAIRQLRLGNWVERGEERRRRVSLEIEEVEYRQTDSSKEGLGVGGEAGRLAFATS